MLDTGVSGEGGQWRIQVCLGREKSDGYRCVLGQRAVEDTGASGERGEWRIQVYMGRERSGGYRCVWGGRGV